MTNKLNIKILCHNCGAVFYVDVDTDNILRQCNMCYNK